MTKEEFIKSVGERIRQLRVQKNISQSKLAAICEFEKSSLSRIEAGNVNTTILTLKRISDGLEVPLLELVRPHDRDITTNE